MGAPLLQTTLTYAAIPVVFTIVGAAAGVYMPAMRKLRSHVLHLAAGVVFAVVAVNLLPEIQRRALVTDVVLGFVMGIVTMLVVDKILDGLRDDDRAETHGGAPAATAGKVELSLLAAVGIDFMLDGLLLGVGFAAGAKIGLFLPSQKPQSN